VIVLFSLLGTTGKIKRSGYDEKVFQSMEAMNHIADAIKITEAEVNKYILTREEEHIKNYRKKRKPLEEKLAFLEELLKDSPEQRKKIKRLKQLVNNHIFVMESSIQLMKNQGIVTASEYLKKKKKDGELETIDWLQSELVKEQQASMFSRQKELEFAMKSREYIVISASIASLLISTIAIGTIVTDLNEKREREKYLEAVNHNKDRFFSLISHDLKGPAHNLIGITEILLNDKELSEEEKQGFLVYLNTAAKKNFNLLENLLEWSKIQMGSIQLEKESVNLGDTVKETLAMAEENIARKKLNIVNSIGDKNLIFADANSIKTVIRNLLSNAIKYTPAEGTIEFSTEIKENSIIFAIKDSGIGMDDKTLANLFNAGKMVSRYGTDGETGTGIGLLLCQEFIEKNDGSISVDSKDGAGTTFYLTLPRTR
jgi:signal transduction histidine kinase